MNRKIFIGDIQGCYDEFQLLLKEIHYQKSDQLYLVGDVINRGPKSHLVLDWLLEHPEVQVVCGNHEWHFLKRKSTDALRQHRSTQKTFKLLEPRWESYQALMASWPYYIENDDFILVHAGFRTEKPLSENEPHDLMTLRMIEDEYGEQIPWHSTYRGEKLVIFGHWALQGLYINGHLRGLDSGCVYGNHLSALLLPEDQIVQVPALKTYYDHRTSMETW